MATKLPTVSILDTLAVLPSGTRSATLTLPELGVYLEREVGQENERQRNTRHALRDELYRDGGVAYMRGVIDKVFKDTTVRSLRKEWVEHARFTNPLKRIINEISTVYARPAKRSVKSGDDKYQKLLKLIRMDEQMLQLSRLLNLHRALLVGFRVRQRVNGQREPVMDIATPANVRAVVHPNDDKLVVGWIVRACHKPVRPNPNTPVWMLWTDHERVSLRDNFEPIGESYVEHGLGVCPWVPVTLSPPQAGFWPGDEGEDLVAARIAVWFEGVLLLKESKSATKQTVLSGDGTAMARGQAADSEVPTELADGQSVTTVDMSMDLGLFRETDDHITERAALDYGMSAALVNHQGVQSAEARELMREPLYEIRDHQQTPLREFETAYAIVEAAVLEIDHPELAFDPSGFELQFGNDKLKLDPVKEQQLFEERRKAGLTSTIRFMCDNRPGLTPEDAQSELEENIAHETARNILMRPLQAISGSMGAGMPEHSGGEQTAQPIDPAPSSQPVADPGVASVPGATEDVQKSALNGAQMEAMLLVIRDVVTGTISRESGAAALRVGFQISESEAQQLLGPVDFEPTELAPKPATPRPNVLDEGQRPTDSAQ